MYVDWVRSGLSARNPRTAALTAGWMYAISAAVIAVSNLALPAVMIADERVAVLSAPVVILALGVLLISGRLPPGMRDVLLSLAPLLGAIFVVTLDLATRDTSAGAQVAMCLPALFAASQLKPLGALVGAGACIVGDAILVARLKPDGAGLIDVIDIALTIGLMTGLLVVAGRRQDRLIVMLQAQAALDPLTGLVTRRVLDEAMQKALTGARPIPRQVAQDPSPEQGTALILVDVDHFKTINDTFGHPVGDDALVHVAGLLSRNARPDTVISRLGGDEMAVLLPRCGPETAQERARDFLRRVVEHPLRLPSGAQIDISVSVGVAHTRVGGGHLRDLYSAADISLYEAKRAGRGRVGSTAAPVASGPGG